MKSNVQGKVMESNLIVFNIKYQFIILKVEPILKIFLMQFIFVKHVKSTY